MAQLRVEGFPDVLYQKLKVCAALQGTTVKALLIAAVENITEGITDDAIRTGKLRKAGGK
jgi:hypothetical protein